MAIEFTSTVGCRARGAVLLRRNNELFFESIIPYGGISMMKFVTVAVFDDFSLAALTWA